MNRGDNMWQYQYPDELYHWKYISRKKVNGKWQYTYDYDLDNKYKGNEKVRSVESERFGDNGYVTRARTVTYKDSDSLFSKKEKTPTHINLKGVKSETGKFTDLYTERVAEKHSRGVLERAQAKGEKYIYENILKDGSKARRKLDQIKTSAAKGRNYIKSLFNR